MSNWSRRRILRGVAAAGAFALAGCLEAPTSNAQPSGPGRQVKDVDVLFVRDENCGALFDVEGSTDEWKFEYLTHPLARNDVTFRSTPEAERLRAFVDATDLDSEAVLLFERPVSECRRVGLVMVYRNPDHVSAEFCLGERDADGCVGDEEDTVGIAIRLPFDGDVTDSRAYEWGSDCDGKALLASE